MRVLSSTPAMMNRYHVTVMASIVRSTTLIATGKTPQSIAGISARGRPIRQFDFIPGGSHGCEQRRHPFGRRNRQLATPRDGSSPRLAFTDPQS
jgi:hypothetical protein